LRGFENNRKGGNVTIPELNNGAALLKVQFKAGAGAVRKEYSNPSEEPKKRMGEVGCKDGVAMTGPSVV
jgi:hypothetical protein